MIEIAQMLKAKGLKSQVLREEYLDHYGSQYESLRKDGLLHEQAISIIQGEVQQMNIKKAHQEYFDLHFKKPILMTSSLLVLISVLFFIPINKEALLSDHNCTDEVEHMAVLASYQEPPSINPVANEFLKLTSKYGPQFHPVQKKKVIHKGVDISAKTGTPVLATSSGRIIKAGYDKQKGNYIEISHDDIYSTRYYHLSKIDVEVNQQVTKGNKIGEVGSSGASTGPHLHYEVIKAGKNVDPGDYLKV